MLRMEELDTVKAIVRALLIADKRSFTVRQFINEYKSSEGQNLPYAKFGYSDPLNFLKSIPDTVQVYQHGNDFYVKPTVTQDVQHVQNLVSRQKDSTSKPSATAQRRYNRPFSMPPRRLGPPLAMMPRRIGPPPTALPTLADHLTRVKNNIGDLLSTWNGGITLRQLEEIYARKYGTGINYTYLGHGSLESFVKSLSDILCFTDNAVGETKFFRIRNETDDTNPRPASVQASAPSFAAHKPQFTHTAGTSSYPQKLRQKTPSSYPKIDNTANTEKRNPPPAGIMPSSIPMVSTAILPTPVGLTPVGLTPVGPTRVGPTPMGPRPRRPTTMAPALMAPPQMAPTLVVPTPKVPTPTVPTSSSVHRQGSMMSLELPPTTMDWTPNSSVPAIPAASRPPPACADVKFGSSQSDSLSSSSSDRVFNSAIGGGAGGLSAKVVDGFKKVFSNNRDGIWLKDFKETYQSETGEELRVGELGFSTLLEFLESCSDVLEVRRPTRGGDFMVCPVNRHTQPYIDPKALALIETILRASDSRGLTLDELIQAYLEMSGVPLSPLDLGFSRLGFAIYLTGHLPVAYETFGRGRGQFVLKWNSREDDGGRSLAQPSVPRPPVVSPSPSLLSSGPFKVQEGLLENDYRPVYVSHIFSIHHFYLQLKGEDTSLQLEVLMNDLEEVYKGDPSKTEVVEERLVRQGLPCAAPYNYADGTFDWHRALVVSVGPDPLFCKVLYVDYGTMADVKKTVLRTLKDEFLELPAQAIRASLGQLKPPTLAGWTLESKARFMKLISDDRTLMCRVVARQGLSCSVSLCDTGYDPEVYIEDLLVAEGHALAADTLPQLTEVHDQAVAQAVNQQGTLLATQQESQQVGRQANVRTGWEATGPQLPRPPLLPAPKQSTQQASRSTSQQNGQAFSSQPVPDSAVALEENEDFMSVLRRELDEPCNVRSIKPEYLKSGKCLMVLNYDQLPYVSSANVGQLLGLTSDQLLQNLEEKEIQFRTLVLSSNSNVELFNQMAGYDVPGVKVKRSLARQVTFFPLKNVNDLLNLFECPAPRLRQEVATVLKSFDPNADYWTVMSDESDSDEPPSVVDELRKLSARRKEIHADIMTSQVSHLKVDELSSIEDKIARCEALLSGFAGSNPTSHAVKK